MLRDRWIFGRKSASFTLQWHLTNQCAQHCRHCYDRSARGELAWEEARAVLEDLGAFCRRKRVRPQVCLTGGDPMCSPHFWGIYGEVARRGWEVSILGNPVSREVMERVMSVKAPEYYQVSLEGLREHNDWMRGSGHFERTLRFLGEARELGLRTHVMVTLTKANLREVVPLGEALRLLTCRMTFNRMSQVGEAVELETAGRQELEGFLVEYLAARRDNPVLGVKDNLLNIVRERHGRALFHGCTGAGCGAAFNFVALLPDGEVHACRKFPSPIGQVRETGLAAIYASAAAARYRAGSVGCQGCRLRKRCGGCLAVAYGQGLDPLHDRDPQCFRDPRPNHGLG